MTVKRTYWQNVLVGLDQFTGTLFGIDADETISSYVGRNFPGSWKEKLINWLFNDSNHCQNNIEWDEAYDSTTEHNDCSSCGCGGSKSDGDTA